MPAEPRYFTVVMRFGGGKPQHSTRVRATDFRDAVDKAVKKNWGSKAEARWPGVPASGEFVEVIKDGGRVSSFVAVEAT